MAGKQEKEKKDEKQEKPGEKEKKTRKARFKKKYKLDPKKAKENFSWGTNMLAKSFFNTDARKPCSRGWSVYAPDQYTRLNFTGPLGSVEAMWTSLLFKWNNDFTGVYKEDEWFHVTPSPDNLIYSRTVKTKEEIEAKIRATLADLQKEVQELELARHDVRVSKQMLDNFEQENEAALKIMFVDQVDYYAGDVSGGGQGPGRLSMAFMRNMNIFPTIVDDFLRMKDEKDLEKDGPLGDLPPAEKNFLRVKWQAYQSWKKYFRQALEQRYRTAMSLLRSKEQLLEQRKEWLKPWVARHKMLSDALTSEGAAAKIASSFVERIGELRSMSGEVITIMRAFHIQEANLEPAELWEKEGIEAYDDYIQEEMIYHGNGLLGLFPWLTEKWVESKVEELVMNKRSFDMGGPLAEKPIKEWWPYYVFFRVEFEKANITLVPGGQKVDVEDGTWTTTSRCMTKNLALLQLLYFEAQKEQFAREVRALIDPPEEPFYVEYMKYKGRYILLEKRLDDSKDDSPIICEEQELCPAPESFWKDKDIRKAREKVLEDKKEEIEKELRKHGIHRPVVFRRISHLHVTTPEARYRKTIEKLEKTLTTLLGFEIYLTQKKGPYQNTPLKDRFTKDFAKPMGKIWGKEVVGAIMKKMRIGQPWG